MWKSNNSKDLTDYAFAFDKLNPQTDQANWIQLILIDHWEIII